MILTFSMTIRFRASPDEPMRRPYEKPLQTPVPLGLKRPLGIKTGFCGSGSLFPFLGSVLASEVLRWPQEREKTPPGPLQIIGIPCPFSTGPPKSENDPKSESTGPENHFLGPVTPKSHLLLKFTETPKRVKVELVFSRSYSYDFEGSQMTTFSTKIMSKQENPGISQKTLRRRGKLENRSSPLAKTV